MEYNYFKSLMFADTPENIEKRCAGHFSSESFKCMMETHMKTDNNSFTDEKVVTNDHDAAVYKIAYEEGYKAGWKRCISSASKAWADEEKEKGSNFKFGDF